jgi:hypothetical protein
MIRKGGEEASTERQGHDGRRASHTDDGRSEDAIAKEVNRAPYILGAIVAVAVILQLFFRYQYVAMPGTSGQPDPYGGWDPGTPPYLLRVDRLTGASCNMPCLTPEREPPVTRPPSPTDTPLPPPTATLPPPSISPQLSVAAVESVNKLLQAMKSVGTSRTLTYGFQLLRSDATYAGAYYRLLHSVPGSVLRTQSGVLLDDSVEEPIETVRTPHGQFIIADVCKPHDCGDNYGWYIYDVQQRAMMAWTFYNGQEGSFGDLHNPDVAPLILVLRAVDAAGYDEGVASVSYPLPLAKREVILNTIRQLR